MMGIIDHFSNFIGETEHFGGKNGATEFRFSAFVIRYNASPIQGPTMQYVLVNTVPFSSLFFLSLLLKIHSFSFLKGNFFLKTPKTALILKRCIQQLRFSLGSNLVNFFFFNGAETNCGIVHILGILLMNSCDFQIFRATTICCLSSLNAYIRPSVRTSTPSFQRLCKMAHFYTQLGVQDITPSVFKFVFDIILCYGQLTAAKKGYQLINVT